MSGTADDGIDLDLITTYGRLVEAAAHLELTLGRALRAAVDLPGTWLEVMLRVSRSPQGRVAMSALGAQVALTSGGTTKVVDRLVAVGYARRMPSPTDRRVVQVTLTPQGQEVLREASIAHTRHLREAFTGLDADQRATLDDLLDRLRPPAR